MRQRFRNKRRRAERQDEAAERQARYDALSTVEKFNRIRGPIDGREGSRLLAILNEDTTRRFEAAGLIQADKLA